MPETMLAAGLSLRGLTKSYGPVRAVAGVDLDIVAGETVALLGPNGAGKSTTIDMLLGLAHPDAGEVTVFGRTPEEAVRAGLVGAMLQSGGLISEVSDDFAVVSRATGGTEVRIRFNLVTADVPMPQTAYPARVNGSGGQRTGFSPSMSVA